MAKNSATEMNEAQLAIMHQEISQIKDEYDQKLKMAVENGKVEEDKLKILKDATVK